MTDSDKPRASSGTDAPQISNRTPLLDRIHLPADLRQLPARELRQLADELRHETIDAVSSTGGHLGAGLGVVELTVALHYVFNTPKDRLIWDVGHQAYPHKILTGRRDRIRTLRQGEGLSGFTKRTESDYDPFGAGHSSTSISAGLGMAVARDLAGGTNRVVSVIGDGAMTAGMAYEALNNAGALKSRMLVVLNDNEMSIAPPVGALSSYLTHLVSSRPYLSLKSIAKNLAEHFPEPLRQATERAKQLANTIAHGPNLFESLGFRYLGPIDGHDLDQLVPCLQAIRDAAYDGPVLLHVITEKGRGFSPARTQKEKCHAVAKFNPETGEQHKPAPKAPTYTRVFADSLIALAKQDPKIVTLTAAMPSGTGVDVFQKAFPERSFDVGIAEQHAVTFAAGMATEGFRPFAAIYSTFLQRAYDQVVHDVALQKLPVRFAIDRAGLVGADGQTHAGAFDIAYLGCLPNIVLMACADEADLVRMVATAAQIDDRPSAFRFPRGEGLGLTLPDPTETLEIGRGRIVREGTDIAILSYGARLPQALQAADLLAAEHGLQCTVADARFAKPLDEALILQLARHHGALVTLEEGSVGGFGSQVLHFLAWAGVLDTGLKVRPMTLPDRFQDHHKPETQYAEAGLVAADIVRLAQSLPLTGGRRVWQEAGE